jgi:hypothetical protein
MLTGNTSTVILNSWQKLRKIKRGNTTIDKVGVKAAPFTSEMNDLIL